MGVGVVVGVDVGFGVSVAVGLGVCVGVSVTVGIGLGVAIDRTLKIGDGVLGGLLSQEGRTATTITRLSSNPETRQLTGNRPP